ncbi:hypothetical protein Efla_005888 [Eimeria flavescens]
MGRAKRSNGGDGLGAPGSRGGGGPPPTCPAGAPQGPALCVASRGCPLSAPSRRVPSGKRHELWSDGFPQRRRFFTDDGCLVACTCHSHEGVQLQTVEEVAAARGRVVTTSYVFISDEGSPPSAAAGAPRAPTSAALVAAAAAAGKTPAAAPAAGGGGGGPPAAKRPRGSKPRELWLALSQLEGSIGYLSVGSLTLGGRGPIDLRRPCAVPMLARDRGPLSRSRSLKEEILLAITEGATHDLLRPARIDRKDHHIRGLPSLRKKDKLDVDEVVVAGAYLGEVRYDIVQAKAVESCSSSRSSSSNSSSSNSCSSSKSNSSNSSSSRSGRDVAGECARPSQWLHAQTPRDCSSSSTASSSSKSLSSSSSSSSSSSGVYEASVCVSPLTTVPMDYGMSCGWDSSSRAFVQPKAQRRIVFHRLARPQKNRGTQAAAAAATAVAADKDGPARVIPSDELGLQADGSIVLPGHDWMCIDAEQYFNITSLMNDSRCILEAKRLKDTFGLSVQVHYEGFPYLVLIKKQGQELLHMEECLVNCGPLFRLGHLQPLCEAALYDEADDKPLAGTKARVRRDAGAQAVCDGLGGQT